MVIYNKFSFVYAMAMIKEKDLMNAGLQHKHSKH